MTRKVYGRMSSEIGRGNKDTKSFKDGVRYTDYINRIEVKAKYLDTKVRAYIRGLITDSDIIKLLEEHRRMKGVYETAKKLEKRYGYSDARLEIATKEFIEIHRDVCYLFQDELTRRFEAGELEK